MFQICSTDPFDLADLFEYNIMLKFKTISKSKILDFFKNTGLNDEEMEEELVDSIFNELLNRESLYGQYCPFTINNNKIKPVMNWKKYPELFMCLIFSLKGVEKKKNQNDGTKLFEIISANALKNYLNGQVEIIGFPNKTRLQAQIAEIAKQQNEILGRYIPKPTDKDIGVDLIGWIPHNDNRKNQIVTLIQCASGKHFNKKKPPSISQWRTFIEWAIDPIPGITIPGIASETKFSDLTHHYKLVFDRIRISRWLYKSNSIDSKSRKEILDWCKSNLIV